MSFILSGLEGVVCMVDDVLVSGSTQEQHDQRLEKVLDKISPAGVTLNVEKCVLLPDEYMLCTASVQVIARILSQYTSHKI